MLSPIPIPVSPNTSTTPPLSSTPSYTPIATPLQTPSIQVSPPESPTTPEMPQEEVPQEPQPQVQQRAKLNQRILSLPTKRRQPPKADPLIDRPVLWLPSLDTLASKYREKLTFEPKSPKRKLDDPSTLQPLKSPKSPKRGSTLKELLERRSATSIRLDSPILRCSASCTGSYSSTPQGDVLCPT